MGEEVPPWRHAIWVRHLEAKNIELKTPCKLLAVFEETHGLVDLERCMVQMEASQQKYGSKIGRKSYPKCYNPSHKPRSKDSNLT